MFLHQTQSQVAKDRHRFRVLRCGRRWGKTTLIAEEIKGVIIPRPARVAYIANNYQQARDIMWEVLKKELRGATIDTNEGRLEIKTRTLSGGESYTVLRGWESVENLRGQAFDFLGIDEVASMKRFWANWEEVLRPTLTDRKGTAMFTSTPKGYNHFYDLCNSELEDKDFKTFHFTSFDNPHLPKDELESAKSTLSPERFEQEYLASFQKTEGLVYKEFSRDKHLYDELPWRDPHFQLPFKKYGAIDFGFRNPAVVLDVRFDQNETIYIEDEWYKTGRTDIQVAEYVAASKFEAVYPDPENPGAIEELRRKGVNVREVVKGKGSIESGIQSVREMLVRGTLKVNRRCVNLISEFETYSYDEESDKDDTEKPVKANDHALDALRYVVTSLLPIVSRIEQRERLRRYGPQKVKANQAR